MLLKKKTGRGQSMVEFALILPLLIIVIVGVFDLGRAFFAYIAITNAAREGARYWTLNADHQAGVAIAVRNEIVGNNPSIVDPNAVVIIANCTDANGDNSCDSHTAVTVTVQYPFNSILNSFIPATITMQRSIQMAVP